MAAGSHSTAPSSDGPSSESPVTTTAAAAIVVVVLLLVLGVGALGYKSWSSSSDGAAGLAASYADPGAGFAAAGDRHAFANPAYAQGPMQAAGEVVFASSPAGSGVHQPQAAPALDLYAVFDQSDGTEVAPSHTAQEAHGATPTTTDVATFDGFDSDEDV